MPYIMTLVSLFTADSIIKSWIEKNWAANQTCKNRIVIKKYHNKGAMFNFCDKSQDLVAILSLVLSAFVSGIFVAVLQRKGAHIQKTGLALVWVVPIATHTTVLKESTWLIISLYRLKQKI